MAGLNPPLPLGDRCYPPPPGHRKFRTLGHAQTPSTLNRAAGPAQSRIQRRNKGLARTDAAQSHAATSPSYLVPRCFAAMKPPDTNEFIPAPRQFTTAATPTQQRGLLSQNQGDTRAGGTYVCRLPSCCICRRPTGSCFRPRCRSWRPTRPVPRHWLTHGHTPTKPQTHTTYLLQPGEVN